MFSCCVGSAQRSEEVQELARLNPNERLKIYRYAHLYKESIFTPKDILLLLATSAAVFAITNFSQDPHYSENIIASLSLVVGYKKVYSWFKATDEVITLRVEILQAGIIELRILQKLERLLRHDCCDNVLKLISSENLALEPQTLQSSASEHVENDLEVPLLPMN